MQFPLLVLARIQDLTLGGTTVTDAEGANDAMAATGVVALPGMMTGQILAGAAPSEAVKYQLLILFLIAGATSFGVIVAVMGTAWRLTDPRDRLRLDRLRSK